MQKGGYALMDSTKIDFMKVDQVITNLRKQFGHDVSHGYFHYTGVNTLFKILETDSFRASNVRFSNDDSEERIMGDANSYMKDDYIVCFCSQGDLLSQWRGYCYDGGVSIEFEMLKSCTFSLKSPKGSIYPIVAKPLPVIYCPTKYFDYSDFYDNVTRWIDKAGLTDIDPDWFFPYLKNELFAEEDELRLVFSSNEGALSEWIQYRDLSNGIKLPYITVMHGDQSIMQCQKCRFDVKDFSDDKIQKIFDGETVWIPEGQDQISKYYELKKVLNDYARRHELLIKDAHVFCKGHLPIKRIIVSPSYDQEKLIEQIGHYCSSKYWLKDVIVEGSKIPYIRPVH